MVCQPLLATPDNSTNRLTFRLVTIADHLTDDFEWNGRRWRLRFQSWVRKPQEVDPILPDLLDVFPEDHPDYGKTCADSGDRDLGDNS